MRAVESICPSGNSWLRRPVMLPIALCAAFLSPSVACAEQGLRISRYLGNSPRLRMVTHANVSRGDVDSAVAIASAILRSAPRTATAP